LVLLVLIGAIGGAVLMSMAQRLRRAAPVDVPAAVPAQIPSADSGLGNSLPAAESHDVPKPRHFTRTTPAGRPQTVPAPLTASPSTSGPTIAPPPARTEPEPVAPVSSGDSTPAPPPRQVTLNAGLLLPVRLADGLSTERNAPGDAFRATLDRDLAVDGLVIAERGARVEGKVVAVEAGAGGKSAALTVELTRPYTNDGQTVTIRTDSFERHTGMAGGMTIQLPAATRIAFRVKTQVILTEMLRR